MIAVDHCEFCKLHGALKINTKINTGLIFSPHIDLANSPSEPEC